ncbi:MAG: glycoside hydrolase family 43 protein [Nocardioidaceae bacterium]
MPDTHFVNPFAEGADPAVARDGDRYLWCQSEGNVAVAIWVSDRPTSLGTKHVVWEAPDDVRYSREVWAPELFSFDGHWYIYFAASDGDDMSHLTYVLESESDDPLGDYVLYGPLQTGESAEPGADNIWSIDMTVLELAGRRYAIWSGWPEPGRNQQDLYIAPMESPVRIGGDRVLLCKPGAYAWERIDETPQSKALAEGPQVLQRGDRTFLVYSCAASWLPSYKMGLLELVGDDPLDPAGWKRLPTPLFQSNDATYGVGHACYTTSPDGRDWWHIFHAKRDREPGWRRALYAQPMRWRADGTPDLGQPVPAGAPVPIPSGTPDHDVPTARGWRFALHGQEDFDYYGHHQYFWVGPDGLHLGLLPQTPVNAYRSGEKVVLSNGDYRDVRVVADFEVLDGSHDVGLIFRVTRPAVGFDSLRGYFVGVSTGRSTVVLGAMDGHSWREIAIAPVYLAATGPQRIAVDASGPDISVYVGNDPQPVIKVTDTHYTRGSVGCRVVDTHAVFSSLSATPL